MGGAQTLLGRFLLLRPGGALGRARALRLQGEPSEAALALLLLGGRGLGGRDVLVERRRLVVVFRRLVFGALPVRRRGGPAVRRVQEPGVVAALRRRGDGGPAAEVALVSTVAAETGSGHLVVAGLSDALQRRGAARVQGEAGGRAGPHVQLGGERPRRLQAAGRQRARRRRPGGRALRLDAAHEGADRESS